MKQSNKHLMIAIITTIILACVYGVAIASEMTTNTSKTATVTLYGGGIYNVPGRWTNARNVVINGHSVTFTHKGKLITVMGNVVVEF